MIRNIKEKAQIMKIHVISSISFTAMLHTSFATMQMQFRTIL